MPQLDSNTKNTPSLLKGLVPLLIFSFLASQDYVVDIYGAICKPVALFCLNLASLSTADHGVYFTVNQLTIPWTRDCAGMNLLLVLLAVYTWMNRDVEQNSKYFWRLACIIPAAIASNVLRVLTLVGYRYFVYPEVESPQLHYFFGLFWLIPFALLAIPRNTERSKKSLFFELLHISTVIALLAPLLNISYHWLTALAALLYLLNSNFTNNFHKYHIRLLILWFFVALIIIWIGIESLWLPWLLTCPLTVNLNWLRSPSGIICLCVSCPLFVLIPGANIWGLGILAFSVLTWYKQKILKSKTPLVCLNRTWERSLTACTAPLLFLPFLASIIFNVNINHLQPPADVKQRVLQGMGYELRLEGQSPELGLLWYDPQGSDRHHAIEVCLQYRGIHLKESNIPNVKTDGQRWFREFFIVRENLLDNHRDYLWHTFGFRQDPGIHIIIVSEEENFSAENFAEKSQKTADKLFQKLFGPAV
ncbi:exosortase/archaeosortase family protein [Lentisphaera profundi]|uniref:Exosortase/archaeosortase family protein n=1 Tax=Lentisphaera profundi TaxID=1658616 RepID=A0ABY7VTY1_9BACT|nr:exosortase/archaeosortase family protein [Lentisphaera profundi]WDE97366.1 exosortase/archaeosortase family protein [Lentisphaera profundi]